MRSLRTVLLAAVVVSRSVEAWGATARKRLAGLFVVSNVCQGAVVRLVLYWTVTVWPTLQRTSKLKLEAVNARLVRINVPAVDPLVVLNVNSVCVTR